MPLNKDVLGAALYAKASEYNNIDNDPDTLETVRENFWKGIAEVVIDHIKANATLSVPGTGLVAPSGGGAVTGSSTTGSIN